MENIIDVENENKPELLITIPKIEENYEPIQYCSRLKAIFGKKYNVNFVDNESDNNN